MLVLTESHSLSLQDGETLESWEAMLLGLGELCAGIGAAVADERCEPLAADGLFPAGDLARLLEVAPTPAARGAVLGIATALPFLEASEEICNGYSPEHSQRNLACSSRVLFPVVKAYSVSIAAPMRNLQRVYLDTRGFWDRV